MKATDLSYPATRPALGRIAHIRAVLAARLWLEAVPDDRNRRRAAAYYTDIMQAVVNLALAAHGGPPPNAASFLDRLDVAWLETAYGDGLHEAAVTRIRAAKNHVGDIQLRYATLLGRLGPALDGPGTLHGADAWYCILEGTREPSVAEAQAMALTEVVAHAATSPDRERRAILLAADDYSAVRACPIDLDGSFPVGLRRG
jgi:hypothetical protein